MRERIKKALKWVSPFVPVSFQCRVRVSDRLPTEVILLEEGPTIYVPEFIVKRGAEAVTGALTHALMHYFFYPTREYAQKIYGYVEDHVDDRELVNKAVNLFSDAVITMWAEDTDLGEYVREFEKAMIKHYKKAILNSEMELAVQLIETVTTLRMALRQLLIRRKNARKVVEELSSAFEPINDLQSCVKIAKILKKYEEPEETSTLRSNRVILVEPTKQLREKIEESGQRENERSTKKEAGPEREMGAKGKERGKGKEKRGQEEQKKEETGVKVSWKVKEETSKFGKKGRVTASIGGESYAVEQNEDTIPLPDPEWRGKVKKVSRGLGGSPPLLTDLNLPEEVFYQSDPELLERVREDPSLVEREPKLREISEKYEVEEFKEKIIAYSYAIKGLEKLADLGIGGFEVKEESPFNPFSLDYRVRKFHKGDDIRKILDRDLALIRHGLKTLEGAKVKKPVEEKRVRVIIICDTSGSMRAKIKGVRKLNAVKSLSSAVIMFCKKKKIQVGGYLFTTSVSEVVEPKENILPILSLVGKSQAGGGTDIAKGLSALEELITPKETSVALIFSDLQSATDISGEIKRLKEVYGENLKVYAYWFTKGGGEQTAKKLKAFPDAKVFWVKNIEGLEKQLTVDLKEIEEF